LAFWRRREAKRVQALRSAALSDGPENLATQAAH
jgi:hypothetical protein